MGYEVKQSQYSEVLCDNLENVLVSVYIITVYIFHFSTVRNVITYISFLCPCLDMSPSPGAAPTLHLSSAKLHSMVLAEVPELPSDELLGLVIHDEVGEEEEDGKHAVVVVCVVNVISAFPCQKIVTIIQNEGK